MSLSKSNLPVGKPFKLLLVDTKEDFLLVTPTSCINCLETKKNLTVLKDCGLVVYDKQRILDLNLKPLNVICECESKVIYQDKYTYLKKWFELKDNHALACNGFCNICWWNNVVNINELPECKDCLLDTKACQNELKSNNPIIKIQLVCCKYCVWFDWFHVKRVALASEVGKIIQYKEKK